MCDFDHPNYSNGQTDPDMGDKSSHKNPGNKSRNLDIEALEQQVASSIHKVITVFNLIPEK